MSEESDLLCMVQLWNTVLAKAWRDWHRLHRWDRLRRPMTECEKIRSIKILHQTADSEYRELHPRDWLMGTECEGICEMLGRDHQALRQKVTDQAIRWGERLAA
jgi:hypothetical protein